MDRQGSVHLKLLKNNFCRGNGRSEGLAARGYFIPGGVSQRGVVRPQRSDSHVVRHGHGLTSGCIPLGLVRARRGSSGVCMSPYLSHTPIRVHRVIRDGPSGPVGIYRPHQRKFGQVQKHQIWSQNGWRIDRSAPNKDQMNRIACPDPSRPLLRPKTA